MKGKLNIPDQESPPEQELAFLLLQAVQLNLLRGDIIEGACEAAARAVLVSGEPFVERGPALLDAALASNETGAAIERLVDELHKEVLSNREGDLSPGAARALCSYFQRQDRPLPADLLQISLMESEANIAFAHAIAIVMDRERLFLQLRVQMRKRPAEVCQLLREILAKL